MSKKMVFFFILLLAGILLTQVGFASEGIVYIAGQEIDARVKLRETPKGKIIGQYYSGAHYTSDEEKDGWAHVTIGGRTGWMMKTYLQEGISTTENAPCGHIAFPDSDGCIELIDLESTAHRIPENTTLYVLGTIGETFVHVEAHLQNNEILYGDCIMEKISWTDNFAKAIVRSDRDDLPINVHEEPDIKSASLCKLYPGTAVYLIFDYHNSADGWHRVRIGSMGGYIRDDYLDFSTGGEPLLIPRWGLLKQPSAIVTGSSVSEVYQEDPLFILGTGGSKRTPLYFCEGRAWVDEQTYKTIYFYIQQAYVEDSSAESISTIAHIAGSGGVQAYHFDNNGKIVPDNELGLIPEGTEVQILNSFDEEGQETGWNQYLTQGTVWVSCEIPLGDNSYYGVLIPLKDLSYDSRLMLPTMWTEG
ncbi:MAG: hypothetical protein Q4B32_08725 [Clostridia bacterium]|nr:hypothetical protein [Clostridia bacterium]